MARSRLRLSLSIWFGVAFLLGLTVLSGSLYVYLYRGADERLTTELRTAAREVSEAVRREKEETDTTLVAAVAEVFGEWPGRTETFAVYGPQGRLLETRGSAAILELLPSYTVMEAGTSVSNRRLAGKESARFVRVGDPTLDSMTVVAGRSTEELERFGENLGRWLLIGAPLTLLLALGAGYLMARRSLNPIKEMTRAIGTITPEDLDRRLEVRSPPDELDDLAQRFNSLLERLSDARSRNRRFLAQVAHQIRTPMTVVRGESSLGLGRPRSNAEYHDSLLRIRRAAEQMSHRVDDLFLLAEAQAGQHPPLEDRVELDGLALDCSDMMRGRAQETDHRLILDRVEPCVRVGNESLLREALTELIENALKHSAPGSPVRISAFPEDGSVCMEVVTRGLPLDASCLPQTGLGLSIVRWIARVHDGRLEYVRDGEENRFRLRLSS